MVLYIVHKKWKRVSKNNYFFFISSLIYTIDRNYERFKRVVHFRFRRDKIFDQLHCLHQSVTQIYWSRATRATSNGCLRTEDIKLLNVMHALWARIVVQRENSRRGMRELSFDSFYAQRTFSENFIPSVPLLIYSDNINQYNESSFARLAPNFHPSTLRENSISE